MTMLAHTDPLQHGIVAASCLAATVAYVRRWSADPRRPTLALWCWGTAVAVTLVATLPAVEEWAERSFTGHMVQHLLLIVVVAPAAVVALEPIVRRHRGRGPRHRFARRTLDRTWAAPSAALLFVGVLLVTHLTGIYDAALRSQPIHEAEHVAYLAAAVLLWAALRSGATRRDPAAPFARIAASMGVIVGMAVLGLVLVTASEPLIPTYTTHYGVDGALADQRRAAALMWVSGMLTSLPLLVTAFWRWATHEEATARRREQLARSDGRPGSGARSDGVAVTDGHLTRMSVEESDDGVAVTSRSPDPVRARGRAGSGDLR